jgi:hypothetical protein
MTTLTGWEIAIFNLLPVLRKNDCLKRVPFDCGTRILPGPRKNS